MIPNDILNALLEGSRVKLKEDVFISLCEDEEQKPNNYFLINSIEQSCCSLYNYNTQEVYYEILFDDISLF